MSSVSNIQFAQSLKGSHGIESLSRNIDGAAVNSARESAKFFAKNAPDVTVDGEVAKQTSSKLRMLASDVLDLGDRAVKGASSKLKTVAEFAKKNPGKTALIAAAVAAAGVGIGVLAHKAHEAKEQKEATPVYA